jgi:hypothetical protein
MAELRVTTTVSELLVECTAQYRLMMPRGLFLFRRRHGCLAGECLGVRYMRRVLMSSSYGYPNMQSQKIFLLTSIYFDGQHCMICTYNNV